MIKKRLNVNPDVLAKYANNTLKEPSLIVSSDKDFNQLYKYKNISEGISNDTTFETLEEVPYGDEGCNALRRDNLIPLVSAIVSFLHLFEIVHFDDRPECQYHAANLNC